MALYFPEALAPTVIAQRLVARIVRRHGYPAKLTTVIPLGFQPPPEVFSRRLAPVQREAPLLLTVGGVAHTKGLHDAIVAICSLRVAFPEIQYRIIGEIRDANYLQWLNEMIERLDLEANVQILESLSDSAKQVLIDAADVYVQPSHEEGFCLAFLQAAHCIPRLVATDAGAMRSICGSDPAARVVPIQDSFAIAETVREVLSATVDPALLAERRRRLNESFDWERFAAAHEQIYGELVAGHA